MVETGYLDFCGVKCAFVQNGMNITIIPTDENSYVRFDVAIDQEGKYLHYSSGIYTECIALIQTVHSLDRRAYSLDVRFYEKKLRDDEICYYSFSGDEVDEFFSPIDYFYSQKVKSEYSSTDLLYGNTEVASYSFTYKSKKIDVSIIYGNVLSSGAISDLKIHPRVKVSFEKTKDTQFIFETYLILTRFFQIVRRQKHYNFSKLNLYNDNNCRVGILVEKEYVQDGDKHSFCDATYRYFDEGISSLLQVLADEKRIPYEQYPYHWYEWHKYDGARFAALFSAFEYECEAKKEIYLVTENNSDILAIKEKICKCVEAIEYCNDAEKRFLYEARGRIVQLGTQVGQKKKLENAISVINPLLEHSIKYLVFHNGSIEKTIGRLAKMRGTVVHSDFGYLYNEAEIESIEFLDILQYSMLLSRIGISKVNIEIIIGEFFGCNSLKLDSL